MLVIAFRGRPIRSRPPVYEERLRGGVLPPYHKLYEIIVLRGQIWLLVDFLFKLGHVKVFQKYLLNINKYFIEFKLGSSKIHIYLCVLALLMRSKVTLLFLCCFKSQNLCISYFVYLIAQYVNKLNFVRGV